MINDIRFVNDDDDDSVKDLAEKIVNAGRNCRVSKMYAYQVSSVEKEERRHGNDLVLKVNAMVESLCKEENFVFIDNSIIAEP